MVLEASPFHGVRMVPLSHKLPTLWASLKGEWNDKAESIALANLGDPYGWLDAIRAGFGLPVLRNDSLQCAEYVSLVHQPTMAMQSAMESPTPERIWMHLMLRGVQIQELV